jgi:hypothetical protein
LSGVAHPVPDKHHLANRPRVCDVLNGFVQRDWQGDSLTMARPKGRQLPNRLSVALTDQQLTALESLAQESQAAVSWVVRRAVTEYLERNCPLSSTGGNRTTHTPVTGNHDGTGDYQL